MKNAYQKIRKLENKLTRLNTNHILHLILSIITVGIWIPIWILAAVSNTFGRKSIIRKLDKLES